jgi:PAS domain S-box-containing protein
MSLKTLPGMIWKFLTKPSSMVADVAERRRAELLAGLTFLFATLNLLGLIIGSQSGNLFGSLVLLVLVGTLTIAYALSRSRHYRIGVWMALAAWTVITFGYALSGNTTNGSLFAFAIFLPLVLTFGAAWLDLHSLMIFLGLIVTGYLLSPYIDPALMRNRQFYLLFGILTSQGVLLLVTQNYRDLVELERSERLRMSEARLRGIIEGTPDFILETDRSGTITLINRDQDRYLGRNVQDLILMKDIPMVNAVLEKAYTTGESQSFELQILSQDDGILWGSVRVGPILDQDKVTSLAVIITDITKGKLAEQERENLITELEARNAELTQFTYTVSHELKSPLVTLKGFVGSIYQDLANKKYERAKDDLLRISNATDKMYDTVLDLLELSRIGRLMNETENIPYRDIVQSAIDNVNEQFEKFNIIVHVQPNLPTTVQGDRQRLTDVLQNLLDNAAKYMGDQTNPLVEVGQQGEEDGKPIFFVKDNGIGIAPEYHERIFGLFNKLDATSEGTGVGLTLVKRIIEFHRGRIWVESNLGKGSTFYFTLPRG